MKNVISENDHISWVLGSIESECGDIFVALADENFNDIEKSAQHIHELVDTLYGELEQTEVEDNTVAISVCRDFFDEHNVKNNLSVGDVMKLEQALKEWYESVR